MKPGPPSMSPSISTRRYLVVECSAMKVTTKAINMTVAFFILDLFGGNNYLFGSEDFDWFLSFYLR